MGFTNDWKAAFSSFAQTVISGVQGQGVEGWRHCTFYHDTHLRSYAMMYFLYDEMVLLAAPDSSVC